MSLAPFKRVAAMLQKESLQVLRDPAALAIAFALPPLLLFLFGYAVNLDTARTAIGVAVLDHGDAALSLSSAFQHSRWFDVTTRNSMTALKTDLIAGRGARHRRRTPRFQSQKCCRRWRYSGDYRRLAPEHGELRGGVCGRRARHLGRAAC